jgi:hypothetical protein
MSNLIRLKQSEPFSIRLNLWLKNWFKQHEQYFEFSDVDDFDLYEQKEYLERLKTRFSEERKITVWSGCSDNSIFGDSTVNTYFRAWHDYNHIMHNLDFSFESESLVCSIQLAELPSHYNFEKLLLYADIIGQNLYYKQNNEFPINQRLFVLNFLENPFLTINTKL